MFPGSARVILGMYGCNVIKRHDFLCYSFKPAYLQVTYIFF